MDRVGPSGHVVATDIDTRWLAPSLNLEVRHHHNVVDDPVDRSGYDVIHARLVLEHLPQRLTVLAKLVAALRPGGWLVVETTTYGRSRSLTRHVPPGGRWPVP